MFAIYRQHDVDGQSAPWMYIDCLQTGDDSIIARVPQYNGEDVLTMLAVDRHVSALPPG